MKTRVALVTTFLAAILGCAYTGQRVLVTPSPGFKAIPTTVAIYPLLTTEVRFPTPMPHERPPSPIRVFSSTGEGGAGAEDGYDEKGIYITPPTESKLTVTGYSQLFSDLLAADMTHHGFKLKQLPVEAPVGGDGDERGQQFYVSMELLQRLQEEFGLEAVLLGNVYFEPHRYNADDVAVRAAYVKVVDVKTLDVLCHVSVAGGVYGEDIADVVAQIGAELAGMTAGGSTAPPTESH